MAFRIFGGRVLLEWKEPRKAEQEYVRTLSWPGALLFQHGGAFLCGCIAGIGVILSALLRASDSGNVASPVVIILVCPVLGLTFALFYGLLDLASPSVYLREFCLFHSSGGKLERWNYADLKEYTIEEIFPGGEPVHLLTIQPRAGLSSTMEIADGISLHDVRRILDHGIRSQRRRRKRRRKR